MKQDLFELAPDYRERVWGGPMLTAAARNAGAAGGTIGEAWLIFDGSRIAGGSEDGRTLGEVLQEDGKRILGAAAHRRFGSRLPLLIKVLETADWLSVQVHPDDEQARRMVGPNEFGKTEAWYFLDAPPGSRILAGVRSGVDRVAAAAAIRSGKVLDVIAEMPVRSGDAVLIRAGMLHALGPGLLVYEVQQHSDTTYRAYDWDRPMSAGRKLHTDESCEVVQAYEAEARREAPHPDGESCIAEILDSAYFDVSVAYLAPGKPLRGDADGSVELLTVTTGSVDLSTAAETVHLERFGSAVVAAGAGSYQLRANIASTVVRSVVPDLAL